MMRRRSIAPAFLALLAIGAPAVFRMTPILVWNASPSVPIGLYLIRPLQHPAPFDLVAVMPPEPLAGFLDRRGYLPLGVALMKHVAAVPGQSICRAHDTISVDGVVLGKALSRDSLGRLLPDWQGCKRLADGQVFLMNRGVRDSFDGRYFGALPARSIIGRAIPILTDEAGAGRYEWRAPARLAAHATSPHRNKRSSK